MIIIDSFMCATAVEHRIIMVNCMFYNMLKPYLWRLLYHVLKKGRHEITSACKCARLAPRRREEYKLIVEQNRTYILLNLSITAHRYTYIQLQIHTLKKCGI